MEIIRRATGEGFEPSIWEGDGLPASNEMRKAERAMPAGSAASGCDQHGEVTGLQHLITRP